MNENYLFNSYYLEAFINGLGFDDSGNLFGSGGIGFNNVYGLTFQDNTLFGFTSNQRILEIDTATGFGTQVATVSGLGGNVGGAAPSVSSVPEPTSLLSLLALGSIALVKKLASYKKQ